MARTKRLTVVVTACVLALSLSAHARVIYVDDDANGLDNGTSWANAYQFLQDALADAKSGEKPVEIRVAQGVYKPDRDSAHPQGGPMYPLFELYDEMSLLGGYGGVRALDPNSRDFNACQTILSGDLLGNDAPVTDPANLKSDPTRKDNCRILSIRVYAGGHIRLEGCVITGGVWGAVNVWRKYGLSGDADIVVSDCAFRDNGPTVGDAPGATALQVAGTNVAIRHCCFANNGGELSAVSAGGTIDNCRFVRNCAWNSWGGAALWGMIADCTFMDNRAGGGFALDFSGKALRCVFLANPDGAVFCDGGITDINDCVFAENGGTFGVGSQWRGTVRLNNCLLVGNGGPVDTPGCLWSTCEHSPLELTNCTIADNRIAGNTLFVVDRDSQKASSHVTIRSCILSDGVNKIWSNDSPVEISYTRLPKGGVDANDPNQWLTLGPGNIVADPCFAKPGYWDPNGTPEDANDDYFVEGDYHLKSEFGRWDPNYGTWLADEVTSPCIDAGDPNSPVGDEPEPNGQRINMGAYGGTAEASKKTYSSGSSVIWSYRKLWGWE